MDVSADTHHVRVQIGREPRGKWKVARRCECGCPQVILTEPRLDDGTPFPTTWWLTCKSLSGEVSRLESEGMIARINERLKVDQDLLDAMKRATNNYVQLRDVMEPLGTDIHPGGGPLRVKCLHAHVADQLINGSNPVGKMVLDAIGWSEPLVPCVGLGGGDAP
ncbi:MAG: DUF501 domain-containing protein [Actinomycetota bacterium]|nr:DUF501 domain-containing protein [Actinomycetota bacterium]